MKTHFAQAILRTAIAASMILATGLASAATTTVNLTAQRANGTLPDGTVVPMWGYCGALAANLDASTPAGTVSTVTCGAAWSVGPTITVPAGSSLVVNLTNSLPVPTSLVVLGQLGGGLGTPTRMTSPTHAPQTSTTWPGNATDGGSFTPPAQGDRVMSMATPVAAGAAAVLPAWDNLKPGTYLYETGTLPSIQAPMGLYGVLVVTAAPDTTGTLPVAQAYPGIKYDFDVSALFSEIDPVQNAAVDNAAMKGTSLSKRFDDATCVPNCYPAAVNYTPKYFLINGRAYDKLAPALSAIPVAGTAFAPGAASQGKLLLRLLNAGLRTHIPVVVGLPVAIVAEDGKVPPGNAKIQNEVLLTAGKTHDVLISPPTSAGNYSPASFPLFDRQLSLSNANVSDGGMQAFLQVAGAGAASGAAGGIPAAMVPQANPDFYAVPYNTPINGNVRANDFAVVSATVTAANNPAKGTLVFNADGSFVYTPLAGVSNTVDTFTYTATNGGSTALVTLSIAMGGAPVATNKTFTSNVASLFKTSLPGALSGDTDPSGFALTAVIDSTATATPCASVTLSKDGSFTAVPTAPAVSCSFTYKSVNSQNVASATAATVTVRFSAGSGLGLNVVDSTDATKLITDYRWILQEDLTFKVDPTGTPSLATRTLGTSFHTSHMNVVASGCVGTVSCGAGQFVRGAPASVQTSSLLADVALDPLKHYYISVLPGDAGDGGHAMGGSQIAAAQVAAGSAQTVNVNVTPYDFVPAQLSVFIYEDNAPVNNQNDLNETGLGGFNIILMDAVGRSGDVAGQQTYDAAGMPLSNWLLGRPGCPDDQNTRTNATSDLINGNIVGLVYTCPNAPPGYTGDPAVYALAGHALIKNLTPARYDVIAHPAAARQGAGEVWWQVETLEGTPAQDAFTGVKEPVYFQEFGPPGFHTTIGFVNPARVAAVGDAMRAALPAATPTFSVSGRITNQHMSRPSDVTLWDSGSYDLLSSTTCQVALNSQGGDGAAIAIAQCDRDGNFTLTGIPAGAYELAIWDQWLDQIIQFQALTVGTADVALGNIPVLSWFTQYDQNIYMDLNKNGRYDDGEPGLSNLTMTTRYRDGGISNQTATDSNGNGLLAELFPLFNWYVTEADTTRFKQTGVNVIVDAGGQVDAAGAGAGLWSSTYKDCNAATGLQPCSTDRVETPGAYSYGIQGFISQRNTINWGRTPYAPNENGGIAGYVVYSTTRPFDDQRYNVQTLWEPLVPRVTMNLYRKERNQDGTEKLVLVDTTKTTSFDDFVSAVDPVTGKQTNIQCPGQDPLDPFFKYTLNGTDQFRCYDGWHNWNQVQAAPYDGRYQFPSAAYIAAHALTQAQRAAGQTLVSLPPGQYVVEATTPAGFEIVKEEDKNILNGDSFVAQVPTQFAGIGAVFILPDQATLNNANPNSPLNPDGIANNATSDLGVTASSLIFPECVGVTHRVPDYLSLFPQGGLVAPFAGMDRPLCDRKLVNLNDSQQASATFFVFTQVPMAANGTGIILDDATSEFNAAAPDFGEKASVPFVPVSIKDFNGREISRIYSDQWGAYNVMTPSSWLVNPPTPSGYGPNMLVTCMNDPGPILVGGKMITDPQYNPAYSNFCYTLPFMPGRTTYLDTPVLPIAAFAAGYNQADCAYPDATPAISRVDSSAGFGPYVASTGARTLTIAALGDVDVQNPGYAGPFADPNTPPNNPASKRTVKRHYGFGGAQGKGTVTIGGVIQQVTAWTDTSITVNVAAGTKTGELVITADNGRSSVDAVTVTVGGKAATRVQGANGDTIQKAIDDATPGDLILVDAGTYNEIVIMWKPVRLQGVGAASVIINAAKYPTSKLDAWRPTINSLFSVDITTGNQIGLAQVDPLPTQEITGGVVLLEPSVLGTEEGAGITVLAKNLPSNQCSGGAVSTFGWPVTDSNFLCAASRIDGVSVTGGDAGGGIFVNGWAHNLEISNNRVYGNAGALNGGVRIGVPYLEQEAYTGQTLNANGTLSAPTLVNGAIAGFGYDVNVKIHHNAITKNGTVEATAGAGGAGGGVSICSGSDGYSVDHNWVCGNYSASDGGGIGHVGFSQGGRIANNTIAFNQSFQQSTSTHGGGIAVVGEPPVAGTLSLGTGSMTIDANTVRGNFAEAGHGGGIRFQQVNGADVAAFPNNASRWSSVTVTNNVIDNNVAGYAGGGVSLSDTLMGALRNNTIVSNDSTGIAGTVLANGVALPAATPGVAGTGKPSPAGISSDPTSAQLKSAIGLLSGLSPTQKNISAPTLTNDIVYKNRSFFYKVVGGNSTLCSSNNVADTAAAAACNQLLPQSGTNLAYGTAGYNGTGACMNTNAGAPAYWDLGVLGDTTATPGSNHLNPSFSVLSSVAGYGGGVQTATITHAAVVVRVVLIAAANHGFAVGQPVTVTGVSDARYNGTFTIQAVPNANSFTYADNNFPVIFANSINTGGTASVALPTTNSAADPRLADMYCNGSRVTPEFAGVINPPSVKSLQVAATVDEGNNYVSMRYGPLTMSRPTTAAGTAYAAFGDYHLGADSTNANSSALNRGTTIASVIQDIDGEHRPFGSAYDIGADELSPISLVPGVLAFGNVQTNSGSAPMAVTMTNKQAAAQSLSGANAISITGGNFAQGNNCGASLAAGASCTISVTFTPLGNGAKTATLNAAGQQVVLTGTGVAPSASFVGTSAFGIQQTNTTSDPHLFTYTNTGYGPITVNGAALTASGNYSITANTCVAATVLQPSDLCQVTVTFHPTSGGDHSATLTVNASDSAASQQLTLTGTGVIPVTFTGAAGPNWFTNGGTHTFTVTNTSGAPLTFTAAPAVANATGGSQFTLTGGTCSAGTVLTASGPTSRCTVTITRVRPPPGPSRAGTGTLTITDSFGTQVLNLSGN